MNDQFLKTLDGMIAEEQTKPEGVRSTVNGVQGSLLTHLLEIKDAYEQKDWLGLWRAVRNTIDHMTGDEGMGASPDGVGAVPWLTLLTAALELLKLLRK